MADFAQLLSGLSRRAKWSLGAGLALITVLVALLSWWTLRTPYGVLFSDLSEPDAAAITQELDKLKLPYQLTGQSGGTVGGSGGQTILVPEAQVHKTRLNVMGRQLPLHGAVGFELFNTTDFGASDFVQKVNYQRALQGELTRTILAIEQVKTARIHLALPEQGLFRKEASKAKASVTLALKPGLSLQPAQVLGIQRLIASSVAEVRADDVTVTDQHGTTLSRAALEESAGGSAVALDTGLDLETRLTRKATDVLERLFGAGQALVTVDAVLNHQQTRVTTEEVLAAAGTRPGDVPTGVVVREKSSTRNGSDSSGTSNTPGSAAAGKVNSQEIDYQTGKRVMLVVSPSGALVRLNVAVVIKRHLSDSEVMRVRELVSAAVGLQPGRGDMIALHSMSANGVEAHAEPKAAVPSREAVITEMADSATPALTGSDDPAIKPIWVAGALGLLLLLAGLGAWLFMPHAWRPAPARPLSPPEREAVLKSVHQWLAVSEAKL